MPTNANNLPLAAVEKTLLSDAYSHEKLCVSLYDWAANTCQDNELKNMFKKIADKERQHEQTIAQLMNKYGVSQS